VTVSPVSSTAENVEQHVYFVENRERNLLYHLIKNQDLSDVLVFQNMVQTMSLKLCAKTILQPKPFMGINRKCETTCFEAFKIKKLAFLWQQI
jgi:hypothetical protein